MRSGDTQSSPTAHPDIRITVSGDTYTSQDNGRLTKAYMDEQAWGGQYVFEIDNDDEALNSKDYEGYPATIALGFIGGSVSTMSPVWVHNQQFISKEGKLLLQLNCIDAWGLLSQVNADLAMAAYNQNWQQSSELDERTLPSGEDIPSALKTAIEANYDKTIFDILEDLVGTLGLTVTKDDDDGIVDTRKPPIRISNPVSGIRQLLDMTKCYLKWKTNGNFATYQPDNHSTVYTFDAANLIFNNLEDQAITIPNRVTFYALNAAGDDWIYGTPAVDSTSYSRLGNIYVDRHYLLANFDIDGRSTTTELGALATGALNKIQGERSQGVIVAPMHCSLELFDKIQVDDYMYDTPRSTTGYIHRMIREYDRGIYRITIQVGGVTAGYTPPGGNAPVPLADSSQPNNPVPPVGGGVTMGAYIADIAFTSVDWNTISWGAGTVYLADGRSQSIDSGSFDMDADDVWYFYAVLGNSTLQHSQDATDAVGTDRVLVAVASRGSTTDYDAYVLNPYTDDILINTDKVMDGLITTLKLSDEAVTNAKIAVNAIQGDIIAAGAITETKIANDSISTPKIQAGAVDTTELAAGAVTASKIQADAVTATKIDADAVTSQAIAAGAVTAVKIDVSTLSAISANCGTITSGTINGAIIYGGGGDVLIDGTALKVVGAAAVFYYSTFSSERGYIGGYASDLRMVSTGNNSILIDSDYNLTLQADGNVYINPGSTSYVEILSRGRIYQSYILLPYATSEPTNSLGVLCRNADSGSSEYGELMYYTNTGGGAQWYRCSLIGVTW